MESRQSVSLSLDVQSVPLPSGQATSFSRLRFRPVTELYRAVRAHARTRTAMWCTEEAAGDGTGRAVTGHRHLKRGPDPEELTNIDDLSRPGANGSGTALPQVPLRCCGGAPRHKELQLPLASRPLTYHMTSGAALVPIGTVVILGP